MQRVRNKLEVIIGLELGDQLANVARFVLVTRRRDDFARAYALHAKDDCRGLVVSGVHHTHPRAAREVGAPVAVQTK